MGDYTNLTIGFDKSPRACYTPIGFLNDFYCLKRQFLFVQYLIPVCTAPQAGAFLCFANHNCHNLDKEMENSTSLNSFY